MSVLTSTRGSSTNPACVIWGGYAGGNVGDELTLALAIADAKERFGASVAVLSRDPDYTRWLFPDAAVIPYKPPRSARRADQMLRQIYRSLHGGMRDKRRLRSLMAAAKSILSDGDEVTGWTRAIEGCDELYLAGGGYLTDLFDLAYFAAPLEVAKRAEVSIATAPIGIGPFSSRRAAATVAELLRDENVVVRDGVARSFCIDNGIECGSAPDDGFRAREVVEGLTVLKDASPGEARVGFCIFDQPGGVDPMRSRSWWEAMLRNFRRHSPEAAIEGFCFHNYPELDFRTAVSVFSESGLDPSAVSAPDLDFRASIRSVARYSLVVSSRFHAIVVAILLGLPYIAVASGSYYENKMETLVREDPNNGGRFVRLSDDDPAEVAEWATAAISASMADVRRTDSRFSA